MKHKTIEERIEEFKKKYGNVLKWIAMEHKGEIISGVIVENLGGELLTDYIQALQEHESQIREESDKKYNELIFAVGMKHKGETRHETALRYIRQAETSNGEASITPKTP